MSGVAVDTVASLIRSRRRFLRGAAKTRIAPTMKGEIPSATLRTASKGDKRVVGVASRDEVWHHGGMFWSGVESRGL